MAVKKTVQVIDGVKFHLRKGQAYYVSGPSGYRSRYAHRYVYETANGPIPEGHEIHHIDFDGGNNTLENLELLTIGEHRRLHAERNKRNPGYAKRMDSHMKMMRDKAKAWHSSPEGLAWHKEHGVQCWKGRKKEKRRCVQCKKSYWVHIGVAKRGFCSPKCQSAARRASGVDNEDRVCLLCGTGFSVSRYSRAKCCCLSCGVKYGKRKVSPTT